MELWKGLGAITTTEDHLVNTLKKNIAGAIVRFEKILKINISRLGMLRAQVPALFSLGLLS